MRKRSRRTSLSNVVVKKPPSKTQSKRELRDLQKLMASAVMRPLTADDGMQKRWVDGRSMRGFVAEFIKPNANLTSFERLEIYNRQYWFRLLDCLLEDYPGLRAILGDRKFSRLAVRYLERSPSASFTLRNLGRNLERFIANTPELTEPRHLQCRDMARLEWAHTEAFDTEAKAPATANDLLGKKPTEIRLRLQPHLQLLDLDYPVDALLLSLKRDRGLRSDASNTMGRMRARRRTQIARLLRSEHVYLGVHRFENGVYYKRLDPVQWKLLNAIRKGSSLESACASALRAEKEPRDVDPELIQRWFQNWSALGWFCAR